MQLVTLKKVTRYTKDKDGNPLMSKQNKPYTRLVIETEQHAKPLSGFENQSTSSWAPGQEVEIEVKDTGQYLNFSVPKTEDKVNDKLEMVLNKLTGLQLEIGRLTDALLPQAKVKKQVDDYPENDFGEPPF